MTSETRDELIAEARDRQVDDLAMLVAMLVRHVPDDKSIKAKAVDYLQRHQLLSPLRHSAHPDDQAALEWERMNPPPDRDAIIEECAKVAGKSAAEIEQRAQRAWTNNSNRFGEELDARAEVCREIETAIRALKSPAPPSGDAT